jgi:hypothetical protein
MIVTPKLPEAAILLHHSGHYARARPGDCRRSSDPQLKESIGSISQAREALEGEALEGEALEGEALEGEAPEGRAALHRTMACACD